MKILPFKIPKGSEHSFRIQIDEVDHFYDRFHHHPELQITWIEKGYGSLLLGNSITDFHAGDLFIIGANVPHSFKNDDAFYQDKKRLAKSVSIFFDERSLGQDFFMLPEMATVQSFLKESNRGIRINGQTKNAVISKIDGIQKEEGLKRIISLLQILEYCTASKEIEFLSNVPFSIEPEVLENKKLEAVFQFVMDHYDRSIKLKEVAAIANLSISAFCRFFKLRTRKTFSTFLIEFRISVACKLLLKGEMSISEICYTVGFSNVSNFNRQFKERTGYTPTAFAKQHQEQST